MYAICFYAPTADADAVKEAMFAAGASAHDLYTLSFLSVEDRKGGSDWRTGPQIV